jgi:hypothetical protein
MIFKVGLDITGSNNIIIGNTILCWCMTGKAADFHAIIIERECDISYRKLLQKLEMIFCSRELAETAQVCFQQSSQVQGESLDDWADRVMTLAANAFKALPEYYSNRQTVRKFCEGLVDKEAAVAVPVTMDKPSTMEAAMNKIQWYKPVYGGSKKRASKEVVDDDANVFALEEPPEVAQGNAAPSQ